MNPKIYLMMRYIPISDACLEDMLHNLYFGLAASCHKPLSDLSSMCCCVASIICVVSLHVLPLQMSHWSKIFDLTFSVIVYMAGFLS